MSDIEMSPENLQYFLNAFYGEIVKKRSSMKTKAKLYQYHEGNRVQSIQSIRIESCIVCKDEHLGKVPPPEDMIIVQYKNQDNIACTFSILLEKLKEYDFTPNQLPKKKASCCFPPI